MSNLLSEKFVTPSLPDFIRNLVGTLDAMHREGKYHGKISKEIKPWMDSSGVNFDRDNFRSSAVELGNDVEAQIQQDVKNFVTCSKYWISSPTASLEADFKADLYQGKNLPMLFLKFLESCNPESGSTLRTMADFVKTLEQTPEPNAAAPVEPPQISPPASPPPSTHTANTQFSIALRNGTVGKPYEIEPSAIARAIANQRKDDPEKARISHLQLPDGCGLQFNEQTGAVTGIPIKALEEQLHLDYVPSPNETSITCKVSLLINPDPASLWKDLPPPADAPYQKDLLDDKEYTLGDFRIIAASRRGRSHANKGDFRDDDFAVGYADSTGWLVVVVADGAGSAKYSRKGSQIACMVTSERLVAALNTPEYQTISPPQIEQAEGGPVKPRKWLKELLHEAALDAHYKIQGEADQPSETLPEPPTIRNYDTTLIILVMKKLERGCFTATFSIGDGGAGILDTPDYAEPLTHADGGEHAGQTTFVTISSTVSNTPENLDKRFKMSTTMDFTAALVMTDGITDPKFPSDAAFSDPACWQSLWQELEPALVSSKSLLDWMNFFSPGNHDDRTLIAILPATTPSEE